MSIHDSRFIALLGVLAILSSYGCDDDDRGRDRVDRIGPSPISFIGLGEPPINSTDFYSGGVTLQPTIIIPQHIGGAACPTHPPFLAPIRIVARGIGESDLFLSQVHMRFVDRRGVVGGSMSVARSQLVQLFGSTRIPPSSARSFPFSFPFGCVGEPVGTLSVVVSSEDSDRRERRTSLSVSVGGPK
jgi:hypothetical protein